MRRTHYIGTQNTFLVTYKLFECWNFLCNSKFSQVNITWDTLYFSSVFCRYPFESSIIESWGLNQHTNPLEHLFFFPSQTSYSLTIHSKSIVWTQFVSVFVWNVAQTQKKLAHNLQCNKNRQKRTMTNVAVWSNNNCWENLILTPTPYAVLFYMYVCFTHKKWYSQCTFHLNHSFGSHLLFSTFRILRATNHFFWLHTFIRKKFFFDS